jgi:hypothetical protein
VSIANERLWLLGLVGVLVLAGAVGVAWTSLADPSAEIEVTLQPDAGVDGANVTVERATDGAYETVDRGTVSASSRVVYRTGEPGTYLVRVDVADRSCQRRVSVERTDDGLFARTAPTGSEGWPCADYVAVDVSAGSGAPEPRARPARARS